MKIIIPMAGRGTRLRPHTLTTPKPLFEINGKTIVERLIDGLATSFDRPIDEIAFVIGDFGQDIEKQLITIAENKQAKGSIHYQKQALGTAHAVYCAEPALEGPVVVAFADTLFYSDFKIKENSESVIWTQRVENPEQFGVVITDENHIVTDFTEKPQEFVSDQAIIGIYYFKQGETLSKALKKLIDNKQTVSGEYQLTDALQDLKHNGTPFLTENVNQWLDCGNSQAVLETTKAILDQEGHFVHNKANITESVILPPCHIEEGAEINQSVIGPYVSVGKESRISQSIVSQSLIGCQNTIENTLTKDSLIGHHTQITQTPRKYDLGSHSKIHTD